VTVLGIPGVLTNATYTAPSGTFTMPNARSTCHGVVTVDLSACNLVDGGGNAGLLTASADCTALTVVGAGGGAPINFGPYGVGRGPSGPTGGNYTYITTSATTGPLVAINDTATCTVTINGFTSQGLMKLTTGQGTNPASKVICRGLFCTGLAVAIEGYHSIDVDNCVLIGGGPNLNPVGLHVFQFQGASPPATRSLWVPGLNARLTNSTVTGFVSSATTGFRQGDACLFESDCEYFFIDNCLLGHNSDSGGLDSKACYGQISNCTIQSDGGRAISGHVMGDGRGPWNGVRSINNVIFVNNGTIPLSGGFTEAYQAEGVLSAYNDQVTLASGARLAVTSFQDAPGSGATGSYPRLGTITLSEIVDASGKHLTGPIVFGNDGTHTTVITTLPTAAVTYGTSQPGYPELTPTPPAKRVRCYTPSDVAAVAAGTPITYSASSTMVDGAGTYTGGNQVWGRADLRGDNGAVAQNNALAFLANYFGAVQDLDQMKGCLVHEPDNNGVSYTAAQHKAELIVLMTKLKPMVNANRAHPIAFGPIMTGLFFNNTTAFCDTWISTTPNVDYVGSDPYANLSIWANTAAYAAHLGKPWTVEEFGTSVAANPPDTGAGGHLPHMQAGVAANNSLGNPALSIAWFDHNHNLLDTNLAGATLAGATSIVVNDIPGKVSSPPQPTDHSIANGAVITIDPHGAHPETVGLTSGTTQTASGPATLHVPALAFPHAANAVVWLMPQSAAYWRTPPPQPSGGASFFQQLSTGVSTVAIAKKNAMLARLRVQQPSSAPFLSAASQSFEDGSVGAWYTAGVPLPVLANTTDQAKDGFRSMQVTLASVTGSSFLVSETLLDFPATPGNVMNISIWVYMPTGLPPVQFFTDGLFLFSNPSSRHNVWEQLNFSFVATSTLHTVALFATDTSVAGQKFYVDLASISIASTKTLGARVTSVLPVHPVLVAASSQAVAWTRRIATTVARSVQNQGAGQVNVVAAIEAPARKLAHAVGRRHTAIQAPLAVQGQRALTATARAVETTTKLLAQSTARLQSVTVVQAPIRKLTNAAVVALGTITQAPSKRLSATGVGWSSRIVQNPVESIKAQAVVPSVLQVTQTPAASAVSQVQNLLQTLAASAYTFGHLGQSALSATVRAAQTMTGRPVHQAATAAAGRATAATVGRENNPAVTTSPKVTVAPVRRVQAAVRALFPASAATALGRVVQAVRHRLLAAPTRGVGAVNSAESPGNQVPDVFDIRA
jgi:hypothetical protein